MIILLLIPASICFFCHTSQSAFCGVYKGLVPLTPKKKTGSFTSFNLRNHLNLKKWQTHVFPYLTYINSIKNNIAFPICARIETPGTEIMKLMITFLVGNLICQ